MNNLMKKAGLGIALAATAITAAAPAEAQRYGGYRHGGGYGHYGHRGGNAAGAAILGGIVGLGVGAAIASSNRDRYYDRGYYNRGYYGPQRGGYYYDNYRSRRPRCYRTFQYDPYIGDDVPVRVCR